MDQTGLEIIIHETSVYPTPTPLFSPFSLAVPPAMAKIRLVNGSNHCAGIVEVFHDGQWGTICKDSLWKDKNAEVVCKELGCGTVGETDRHPRKPFHLTLLERVECDGDEPTLKNCAHSPWGHTEFCKSPKFIGGVICTGKWTWMSSNFKSKFVHEKH